MGESSSEEDNEKVEYEMRARMLKRRITEQHKPYYRRHSPSSSGSEKSKDMNDLRKVLLARKSSSTPGKRFQNVEPPTSPKYGKRLKFDPEIHMPIYKDHQLLGDSQFVRFSEQILMLRHSLLKSGSMKSRYIGYCVGGQRIEDLNSRLAATEYDVHKNVILMIGTNDFLYKTPLGSMCKFYKDIIENLLKKCEKIVLLTVPPVPKLEADLYTLQKLIKFNTFIKELAEEFSKKITVVDLGSLLVSYNNLASLDYYEKTFHPGDRIDLIHLNLKGFQMLEAVLDIFYFKKKE